MTAAGVALVRPPRMAMASSNAKVSRHGFPMTHLRLTNQSEIYFARPYCKSCEYYMLCKGGCKRERRDVEKCKAYKTFFRFALPYLKNMS